jgi:hypothetical protein
MTEDTHMWVVENLFDDTPSLMSIHSKKAKAFAAREAYVKDYRHGGELNDYWVHAVRIDWTGLEGETK